MTSVEKVPLSESSTGAPIEVAATTAPGTVIHECPRFLAVTDEVWVYIVNRDSAATTITVNHGGVEWPVEVPEDQGAWLVVPGAILRSDTTTSVTGAGVLQSSVSEVAWTGPDLTATFSADDWVRIDDVEFPFLLVDVTATTLTLNGPWLYAEKAFTTITLLQENSILMYAAGAPDPTPVAFGWVNRITRL